MSGIVLERSWLHGPTAHFVRHFVEMTLAMMVGMLVLGVPVQLAASALGYPGGFRARLPEVAEFLMALEMAAGMVVWMVYRRHRLQLIVEMVAAMTVPILVLIALSLLGGIPASVLSALSSVAMFAGMLGAMLHRRSEYTMDHAAMTHGAM
jgi:hypothetical protein